MRHYFASRAEIKHRELRLLMRRGRTSLLVGLVFLAGCFGLGELVPPVPLGSWSEFVKLGLQIVGWVAMWRPVQIFLYDWWPILRRRDLFARLAVAEVRLKPR